MSGKKVLVLALLVLAGSGFGAWLSLDGSAAQAPEVRIASQSSNATVLDVELHGLTAEQQTVDGTAYTVVNIPGDVMAALDIGKPQVPKLAYLLGIPDGAEVRVSVEVTKRQVLDDVNLYPYQTPATEGSRPPFVIDRGFYEKDGVYPGFDARVMSTGQWRDLPVATIEVYPVHANPARRQLEVYTKFRVRVEYTGGFYTRKTIKPWQAASYAQYVDNFSKLPVKIDGQDNPGVEYLVVAHDNWWDHEWLKDSLLAWHQKRGVETRIIHKSSWTSDEVKDSIKAEYDRHTPAELRWVLLVGEFAEIPMHALGGVGNGDYWYSDLLPSTPDNYPEIALGRLSPSSAQDLENQVRKIMLFTKNPPATANWLTRHELTACSQDYPGKYSGCIRDIYNAPMAWYRYDFDTLMCQYFGNDSIAARINRGFGVVTYRGHGDVDQWYTMANSGGAPWYIANVDALTNGDLTPMVYNIACLCGDISAATCLSEAWMRKYPGGAVGSMAATQASYTYPNHGICSTLVRSMCDTWTISVPGVRDYVLPRWDIGGVQCNVDAYVAKYWPGDPYPDNIYMYNVLGDPAMQVWSGGQPVAPTVTYLPRVPVGPFALEVNVAVAGEPVENARVCAWKSGEFYVVGFTNASGNVTLDINATTPGEFSVTASDGHAATTPHTPMLPFEGTSLAATSGTPYIIYLSCIVNDSPPGGNGDGSLNPGETIILPTWVKNLGDSAAENLSGTLRITDPFATVLDSVRSFGTVPAHDSGWTGVDGFKFSIAPACTSGHRIKLTLQCRDSHDSTWTSNFYLGVGAPELVFENFAVVDTVAGGNGNGRLDPNEPGQIVVTAQNIGIGNAQGVTGYLVSYEPRLVVDDSVSDFGLIPAGSSGGNNADPFNVHTLDLPPGTPLPCSVRLVCGGQSWQFGFTIIGEMNQYDPVPDGPREPAASWAFDNVDAAFRQTPDFNWYEINTRGAALYLGNDSSDFLQLPFTWKVYGQATDYVTICSNGWIAPGNQSSVATPYNEPLPGAPVPGLVAVNWDDLKPDSLGIVYIYNDALHHRYIVEWDNVAYAATPSIRDKFQVMIYDPTVQTPTGDNVIVMQYLTANGFSSSTVGMQNMTMDIGINCLFNGTYHRASAPIDSARAIKITSEVPTAIAEPASTAGNVYAVKAAPNPFSALVRFSPPGAGTWSMHIYDNTGRRVRTLVGQGTLVWDGRNAAGTKVAPGVYFARTVKSGTRTRLVLVR